jgi:D-sedoheptulose 7-phosphate isomerase
MRHITKYLDEAKEILEKIDRVSIEGLLKLLVETKENNGRIFFLGVGGGAGNATHAVNDFRKITGIEAYTPTDNVSELTARINDDGWETVFINWLNGCRLKSSDLLFIFSVGGGSLEKNISVNIIRAIDYAKLVGAKICGVVGRDGGYTAQKADVCVIVPVVNNNVVTPHTESFQAIVLHLLVSHPILSVGKMKWESVQC